MRKKLATIIIFLMMGFALFGCKEEFPINTKLYRTEIKENIDPILTEELELGFNFFWETTNTDLDSDGYGLIPDRYDTKSDRAQNIASIASVGFGLTAIPLGIENDFISRKEGEERAYLTLVSMSKLDRRNGFWFHFYHMNSGTRAWDSEVSIIDSAILLNGALTVGQYFGGRTKKIAQELYETTNWIWYYDSSMNRFYMGYTPERGFEGHWDSYGEQLMLYVLAAGSPTYPVGKGAYNFMKSSSRFQEATDEYGAFYLTHTGSLFTYQFSHAWIDFNQYLDSEGYNWYTNSVHAVEAAISYAKTLTSQYIGINENSWGMSASDGPNGYKGPYGSAPSAGNAHLVDGTVPAYGAIGSIVFKPEEAMAAIRNYKTFPKFYSKYGFKDAYNLSYNGGWFAKDIIGIDKGISVLMIENYISNMIWNIFMEIDYIQTGFKNLEFYKNPNL